MKFADLVVSQSQLRERLPLEEVAAEDHGVLAVRDRVAHRVEVLPHGSGEGVSPKDTNE